MQDETITTIRWGSTIIIVFFLCATFLITWYKPVDIHININTTTDNKTHEIITQTLSLAEYQNCIDKCKYINLAYNTSKDEAYQCFWQCEY